MRPAALHPPACRDCPDCMHQQYKSPSWGTAADPAVYSEALCHNRLACAGLPGPTW